MTEQQRTAVSYLDEPGYVKNVGIVLYRGGLVWLGERADAAGSWQFPQGAVEGDEDLLAAARRELTEETGLTRDDVELMALHGDWTVYHLPKKFATKAKKGQVQKWFLFKLKEADEIDLTKATTPEFQNGKWVSPDAAIAEVADFRKAVYEEVLATFNYEISKA